MIRPFISLGILCLACANPLFADTIQGNRSVIRVKNITNSITRGEPVGVILGVDVPVHADIEVLNENGDLAARPFPVKIQVLSVGANVTVWSFSDSDDMRLLETSGHQVSDLLGSWVGARIGLAAFEDGAQGNIWKKSGQGIWLLDGSLPSGVQFNFSGVYMTVEVDGDAEVEISKDTQLPGSWDSVIELN